MHGPQQIAGAIVADAEVVARFLAGPGVGMLAPEPAGSQGGPGLELDPGGHHSDARGNVLDDQAACEAQGGRGLKAHRATL